jgi:hypothetical protein
MNNVHPKKPEPPRSRLQHIQPGVMFESNTLPFLGGKVQCFAMSMGWPGPVVLGYKQPEYEATSIKAEEWINDNQVRRQLYFGFNPRGHWGLFAKSGENSPEGG